MILKAAALAWISVISRGISGVTGRASFNKLHVVSMNYWYTNLNTNYLAYHSNWLTQQQHRTSKISSLDPCPTPKAVLYDICDHNPLNYCVSNYDTADNIWLVCFHYSWYIPSRSILTRYFFQPLYNSNRWNIRFNFSNSLFEK
jgi:hypothetical protein